MKRNKIEQSGRSMLEMLGVIAIVGILSIGGITGYNKAILRYKTNKQAEQLRTLFNVISIYKNELKLNDGSTGMFYLVPYLKNFNDLPDDMFIKNSNAQIQDIFGTKYSVYHHNTGYIGILTRLKNNNSDVAVCRNLYIIAKEFHDSISNIQIITDYTSHLSQVWGDKYCNKNNKCLINLKVNEVDSLCRVCMDSNNCILYIIWHTQ